MSSTHIRRFLLLPIIVLAVAGCSRSEHMTEPSTQPRFDGGWGYGSGGRSAADSTGGEGATTSAPAGVDADGQDAGETADSGGSAFGGGN